MKIYLKRKSTVIIVVIITILVGSYYLGLSRYTGRYITILINPFIATANHISTSVADYISPFFDRSDLTKKNMDLSSKVIELSRQRIELELLREENKWLKDELKFLDEYKYHHLQARVLGRDMSYISTDIIVNRGASSGIKKGYAVTTNQGVIIGKISEVEENISHVKLLIDNNSKLAATIVGEKHILGVAHGEHNLNLKIDMLEKDKEIFEGDLVASSGLGEYIPAGLIIGQVSKIENNPEKFWQEALIEPAVDYYSIRLVTIIMPEVKIEQIN
jgi:rod shape-determining protein MreC